MKERARRILWWDLSMVTLALVSVGIVAWVDVFDIEWPDPRFVHFAHLDLALVVLFFGEFVVNFARATDRKRFLREHWYDLPGLVPLYAESWAWLRAMRVLRVVRVMRLFRALQALRRLRRAVRFVNRVLTHSRIGYTLTIVGVVVTVMSLGFWVLEHGHNEQLKSFDDALWWSISTLATVGYGDIAPTTGPGRLLAATLMVIGIGIVGVVASSLSAAIIAIGKNVGDHDGSFVDHLERLAQLYEAGRLSDLEFAHAKARLLGTVTAKGIANG